MAAGSLLTLLDDIATVLDDIAVLSKVAAKKTAGVLGDDLALNAEQVSGVKADRELPVVWAVAKGSFLNKLILVPSALVISAFVPVLVNYLLVLGGLYLCFEGAEKLIHMWQARSGHSTEEANEHLAQLNAIDAASLLELEREKIKGAIRTDFILSAEIIVIILGTLQETSLSNQITVLSALAILFTVGVYGFVALIVKLDDAGLALLRASLSGSMQSLKRASGRLLLIIAPLLMKTLSVVGTIAMFLVGGGILAHYVGFIHHWLEPFTEFAGSLNGVLSGLVSFGSEGLLGVAAGFAVLAMVMLWQRAVATFKD
ncbi:DUF808 domain-containing protein [Alteromonas facilis]|uniref:DUF808 domain-containing protein n=1 Tax=Alteromonas facilis TaxID=2048004 RepID=UPI000C28C53A|nr:DUF808 domain-containing protein [Alteromonas facilis]